MRISDWSSDVCSSDLAEAIRITFDADQLRYADLLDIFFATHDPTQLNRPGNDGGTQYRSTIFPQDQMQHHAALGAIERNQAEWTQPIVTPIELADRSWPADDDHKENWEGDGQRNPYCISHKRPKLQKMRKGLTERET